MKIKYSWKAISDDGLLKDPREQRKDWSDWKLNGYFDEGFASKEFAIKALEDWKRTHEYGVEYSFVLVEEYIPGDYE